MSDVDPTAPRPSRFARSELEHVAGDLEVRGHVRVLGPRGVLLGDAPRDTAAEVVVDRAVALLEHVEPLGRVAQRRAVVARVERRAGLVVRELVGEAPEQPAQVAAHVRVGAVRDASDVLMYTTCSAAAPSAVARRATRSRNAAYLRV